MPTRRAASCRALGLAVAGVVLVAACSGSDAAPASSAPSTSAPPSTSRPDDGVFRVGVVIPDGGGAPDLGASMHAAIDAAKANIDSIGVRGQPVQLTFRSEGDSATTALTEVQELVQRGMDAIIGPTSSLNLLATLPTAVKAGVLTCSPTASAMSLDDFPDEGLFFRTVPSDSLQAVAIARVATDIGSPRVAVAYADDAYGRPFASAVLAAVEKEDDGSSVQTFGFPTGEAPPVDVIQSVVDERPEVVIVLANATLGPAIITAVDEALAGAPGPRGSSSSPVQYVVNDPMRRLDPDTSFSDDLTGRIRGVAPRAYPPDTAKDFLASLRTIDPDVGGLFAVNAYDCLTLLALGAEEADSFDGAKISEQLPALTTSGRSCATFSDCITFAVTTPNIDYIGPGRSLAIDADGDPSSATFEVFRTDPETGAEVVTPLSIGTS